MESLSLLTELNQKGKHCTGCGACDNGCPVNAITMCEDDRGFLYPNINTAVCVECGKCIDICTKRGDLAMGKEVAPDCYGVQASDDMRKASSSGGAFGVFANYVLTHGGYVFGASLDDNLEVNHIGISDLSQMPKLQKSKYVQSKTGHTYRMVSDLLKEGKWVLFSGTPCQIAGLYAYLQEQPENLITLDLLCHGVPSEKMLRESLENMFGESQAVGVEFRDKNYGWESLGMTVKLANGTKRRLSYDESRYEQGFHSNMTLRQSCYDCDFCAFPRQGDITIGDFWSIEQIDGTWADRRGTSAVLLNSDKGRAFFEKVRENFARCEQFPLTALEHNRIYPQIEADPGREYFLDLWKDHSFDQAVYLAQQGKYDIGIVGNWSYPNYGTALTYYALYKKLKSFGYAVGMVSWPESADWKPYEKPDLFRKNPYEKYEILPVPKTREELFYQGARCDSFILGSDQLLNNNLYRWFDKFVQLDWVPSYKRKVAYAASFGCDYLWGDPEDHAEMAHFLQQFDFFSMREETGVQLLKDRYGVEAQTVMDPVFFLSQEALMQLESASERKVPEGQYLFAYVLDGDQNISEVLLHCSNLLGKKLCVAGDAAPDEHAVTSVRDHESVYGLSLEEWIAHIHHADFVVTDSFHGMCTAILLRKQFVAIANQARGITRFQSILNRLGLESRMVSSASELMTRTNLMQDIIDYDAVYNRLQEAVAASEAWLARALRQELGVKALSDYDILARRINRQKDTLQSVDLEQWHQLEDHKLRLNGVDSRLAQLERQHGESVRTDMLQWEQLEDHRLRLDGVDARLRSLDHHVAELKNFLQDTVRIRAVWQQEMESLRHQVEELTAEVRALRSRLREME